MKSFEWSGDYEGPVYIINITGDFRSGEYFEEERKKITSSAKKGSASNVIIFDLAKAIYWDTESMNFLNDLLKEINSKQFRAGICGPKLDYVAKRFFEKFGEERGKAVWYETKEEFLTSLKEK